MEGGEEGEHAGPGDEGGEVFQNRELMSLVMSLSGVSIRDLARMARVCRTWRDVTRNPLFPFSVGQALFTGNCQTVSSTSLKWLSSLQHEKIVAASAGGSHCLFLSSSGRVFGLGSNSTGRLGMEHSISSCSTPTLINSLEQYNVIKIEAGFLCSFVLTNEGRVLAFGNNTNGELGLGCNTSPVQPALVEALVSEEIVDISSDMHTLFLTRNGTVYSCGMNRFGQLGHGHNMPDDERTPRRISALVDKPIKVIHAGGSHSFAISIDNQLYGWGRSEHGELGLEEDHCQHLPVPLTIGEGETITHIAKSGRCYTFGKGRSSMKQPPIWEPTVVPGLENQRVITMAGGDDHSVLLTSDGGVYVVGRPHGFNLDAQRQILTHAKRVGGVLKGRPFAVTAGDAFSVILV